MRSVILAFAAVTLLAAAPAADGYAAFDAGIAATKAAMMTDPEAALRRARAAASLAERLPADPRGQIARATAQWLEGEALIGVGTPDKAQAVVEQALAVAAAAAPDAKLHGDLLRSRGAIAAMGGHVQNALRDFQAAYEIFRRAGEKRSEAIALQDIGEIYLDAGDYDRVLRYYAQSAETFRDDPFLLLTTHNNRAQVLRELKRYGEAIAEYRRALTDARRVRSPLLEVRILTNLAATEIDARRYGDAAASIAQAQRLSVSGDAHGWAPFVAGVAAKLAAARGDERGAARLLAMTFAGADLAKTAMPFREFHALAARVYEALGDEQASLTHLKAYHRLDNEARALSASTSAQLVSARFDFTNQNLKIAQLKQGQLARDIRIERQQSRFRTIIFGGLLGAGAIVLALLVAGFISIRRSRNQVRAANADLIVSNANLEKALAAKSEFLAMTSHEIRTPLNGILGMTQVILARPGLDPDMRGQVGVVHSAGEAMKALVDDILDVSKMERGEIALDRAEADLPRLFEELDRLWQGQAALKGLELTLDVADLPRRALTDDTRLRQIASNLVSNAVKFTAEGTVEVVVRREDQSLRLIVRDTGIGILPEHQDAIFESFRQVDAATTRAYGGTGLGLAIVHRLVTAFGGSIDVNSTLGEGSTFTVLLPMHYLPGPANVSRDRLIIAEPNLLRQSMMRGLLAPLFGDIAFVADEPAALAALNDGTGRLFLFDAEAICDGDGARARRLADAAQAKNIDCAILHAADAAWVGDHVDGARFIAKPIDGPGLLAALTSIRVTASAA